MTFRQTMNISDMRCPKKSFKRIIDPHYFSCILLVKNDRGIQHIENLIEVLMLDFLVHADTLVHLINIIERRKQFAFNRSRAPNDKPSRKIPVTYSFRKIEHFFN